jgi:DNA invertase Pin-like site-specific DNA recombinase
MRTTSSPQGADGLSGATIRAAQYVRMSTEHQQYSTENQRDVIQEYAEKRGMVIVKTYADDGKSGLNIDGRDALKLLISDVQNGQADFKAILVYDVSRWGRFQDADESAYYEYICKRAGINVIYCAEQFENDGSPVSTIVKGVKRAMAGEYSRELSVKVFKGQCKLIEQGFRQGGLAGFGIRRMLVDQQGNSKGLLKIGECKSIQTDRVVLVPGPSEEVATVNRIYKMFVEDGKSEAEISRCLNDEALQTDLERSWSKGTVHQVLTNEKYIGSNVYNRMSFKLKMKRIKNPPEMWIRSDGAFASIVNPQLFYKAQGIILERNRRFSDQELLERLKGLYEKHGQLSGLLIDEAEGMPSSSVYRFRFRGLVRAYRMIGYTPDRDYSYIQINQFLRKMHQSSVEDTIKQIEGLGGKIRQDYQTGILFINDEFTVSIVIGRCWQTRNGAFRWLIRIEAGLNPDITVAIRMDSSNKSPLDYYLLPTIDLESEKVRLAEENAVFLETYRFNDLEFFFGMAERVKMRWHYE